MRRAFRRRFGATFLNLARRNRIARGLDLIASGGRVIDGQLDAGFDSASGFRAAVRRTVGHPPARLRPAEDRDRLSSATGFITWCSDLSIENGTLQVLIFNGSRH